MVFWLKGPIVVHKGPKKSERVLNGPKGSKKVQKGSKIEQNFVHLSHAICLSDSIRLLLRQFE